VYDKVFHNPSNLFVTHLLAPFENVCLVYVACMVLVVYHPVKHLSTFSKKIKMARLQDQVGQSEIIPPANCSERIFGGVD